MLRVTMDISTRPSLFYDGATAELFKACDSDCGSKCFRLCSLTMAASNGAYHDHPYTVISNVYL